MRHYGTRNINTDNFIHEECRTSIHREEIGGEDF